MATKNRNDFGDFDFDSNLDFDFDVKPRKGNASKKKDKPISQIIDGVTSSMKSKFTDPHHLKSMMRKALPDGFGKAWDGIEEITTDAQQLYDEATKEIKPYISSITKNIDRLTPDSASRVKKMTRTLREKFSSEVESSSENYRSSADDSGVERMLDELGQVNADQSDSDRQSDMVRRLVEDRISAKRFNAQHKALGVIASETSGIRNYLTTFNVSYQRKSLELQFRSYAAMANLLNNFNNFTKSQKEFQDALLLNTSLPEYAKTSNIQQWKKVSKEQIFSSVGSKLLNNSRIKSAGQKLLKRGREKIASSKDAMAMFSDLLDSAIEAQDTARDMSEFTGQKSSGWKTAGVFGGDMVGDFISDSISDQIKKLMEKNPALVRKSMRAGRYAVNQGGAIKKFKDSKFYKGLGDGTGGVGDLMKSGLGELLSLFSQDAPDMSIKGGRIGQEGEDKIHTQVRVQKSLAEVIPGYLARILREVTVLRTGDNSAGLTVYDSRTGKFKSESRMAADLLEGIRKQAKESKVGASSYGEEMENLFKVFAGKDSKITGKNKQEIQQFLATLARSRDDFDVTSADIKKTSEYASLSKGAKSRVGKILDSRFNNDDVVGETRRFRLAGSLSSTRGSIGSLQGTIDEAIKDGYGDMLENAGIIKPGRDGGYEIDEKAYYEFYDSVFKDSDFNVKHNIRKVTPGGKKALNAINRTPVSDWNYKPGTGHGTGRRRGPMAQDVRKNFGNATAPGGKQIDLVSMNGYTMSAVQELSKMVESMGAGEGLEHLKSIDATLKEMRMTGMGIGGGGAMTGEGMGFAYRPGSMAGAAGALVTGLLEKTGSLAGRVARGVGAAGTMAGSAAGSIWRNNKESIVKARDFAIAGAITTATKAMRLGSDLIFNKIPSGIDFAKGTAKKLMNGIKSILQKSRDLYIPGFSSPVIEGALLEAGFYRDKATGAVLKTIDDVMNAKGDIIDSMDRVRLSAIDRARGVFDSQGKKMASFAKTAFAAAASFAMGAATYGADKVKSLFHTGKGMLGGIMSRGGKLKDKLVGLRGNLADRFANMSGFGFGVGGDNRIVPVLMQIRDILAIGKRGKAIKGILSRELPGSGKPSSSSTQQTPDEGNTDQTNNSLLTQIRDLTSVGKPAALIDEVIKKAGSAKSFFDQPVFGNRAKSWLEKLKKLSGKETANAGQGEIFGPAPEIFGPQMPTAGGGVGSPGLLKSIGSIFGSGKKIVADGASALAEKFPGATGKLGGLFGKLKGSRIGSLVSGGLSAVGGLLSGAKNAVSAMMPEGNNPKQAEAAAVDGTNEYSAATHARRLFELGKARLLGGKRKGEREGGVEDRRADAVANQQANAERKAAAVEESKKSAMAKAGKYSPDQDALEKIVGMAAKVLGGIASTVTSAVGTAADFLLGSGKAGAVLKGGGKLLKGAGGLLLGGGKLLAKGIGGLAKLGIGGVGGIGKAIISVGSKIPGISALGRVAMSASRLASVVGMASGGGTGMLTAVTGAISSAISSPVLIGAAAIAAAGYGGYKLYKYVTRNRIDDWERIRFIQYGLDGTEATETFNSKVKALEAYLLDGKVGYNGGRPYINTKTVDINDVRELFDISEKDSDQASKFGEWYSNRFQAVFLHHVATVFRVDSKSSLDKLDKLKPDQKLAYLSGIQMDDIWTYKTSPFKGLDELGTNPEPAKTLIDAKIKTVGLELKKKSQEDLKTNAGAKGEDAANAKKTITSALPPPLPEPVNKPPSTILPVNKRPVAANSRLARDMAAANGGGGDDGVQPQGGGGSVTFNGSSANNTLKLANGPISNGESGMQYISLGRNAVLEGMQPRMLKHLLAMAQEYGEATGKKISINEGFRSFQRQQQLYNQNPHKAAPPGRSMHEFGLAIDMNTVQLDELENLGLLRKYGFTRPIRGETWHIEPAGIQSGIQRAKSDPAFADMGVESSLGRGGGGIGSKRGQGIGGRDPALAKQIYETAGGVGVDLKNAQGLQASTAPGLSAPMVNGQATMSDKSIQQAAGPGYASIGRGQGIEMSGGNSSPEKSLTSGPEKYGEAKAMIAKYSAEAGADPNKMMMFAAMENSLKASGGNSTTTAGGMMQFVDGTWKEQLGKHGSKYGLERDTPKNDMRASTLMAAEYLKSNSNQLRKTHGNLSFVDEYMSHMLGRGGANRMLSADQNAIAASVVPDLAASNKETFYDRGRPRTVAEVRQFLDNKVRTKAKQFGIDVSGIMGDSANASSFNTPSGTPTTSQNTPESPRKAIPYTPTYDVKPNALAVTGNFGMPDALPFLTKNDNATSSNDTMFSQAQAPKLRAPTAGGLQTKPLDAATQARADIFARLNEASEKQITHLSSIDDNMKKVVPLLEKVAENTAALQGLKDAMKTQGNESPSAGPNSGADAKSGTSRRAADVSSFDNQRRVA